MNGGGFSSNNPSWLECCLIVFFFWVRARAYSLILRIASSVCTLFVHIKMSVCTLLCATVCVK